LSSFVLGLLQVQSFIFLSPSSTLLRRMISLIPFCNFYGFTPLLPQRRRLRQQNRANLALLIFPATPDYSFFPFSPLPSSPSVTDLPLYSPFYFPYLLVGIGFDALAFYFLASPAAPNPTKPIFLAPFPPPPPPIL